MRASRIGVLQDRDRRDCIVSLLTNSLPLLILVLITHFSGSALSRLVGIPLHVTERVPGTWDFAVPDLPEGEYYFSLGRPRAPCEILADGQVVARNASHSATNRDTLLLGTSIWISSEHGVRSIAVRCRGQNGFAALMTNQPTFAVRHWGIALQALRGFTQILLGPLFAILLFCYVLTHNILEFRYQSSEHFSYSRRKRLAAMLGFATVAVIYAVSLAHIPRLWLEGLSFTVFHTVIRSVFALSFFCLCSMYTSLNRWQLSGHLLQLLGQVIVSTWASHVVLDYYKFSFIFFILSAWMSWVLLTKVSRYRTSSLLRLLAGTYALVLPLDYMSSFVWETENLTPAVLAIMCVGMIYLRAQEELVHESAAVATHHIAASFENPSGFQELLSKLALLTGRASRFARTSAYVDAHLIGASDAPGVSMIRVYESGYNKDTTKDRVIVFLEGRGQVMQRALQSQEIAVDRGARDTAWYAVIPLGPQACINISDDSHNYNSEITYRYEVLHLIQPALSRIKERIADFSIKQCFGLERMRGRLGHGRFDRIIGSVFVDVDKYSSLTENYGDAFSSFVSDVYVPSLVKQVGVWAVPEYMRGDEVYFVVLEDLLPKDCHIWTALEHCLERIVAFIEIDGKELAIKNGFPPLTLKAGIAVGPGTLVCDSIKVRTAGQSVNEAKRLMDRAGEGQFLMRVGYSEPMHFGQFKLGSEFLIIQKRTLIRAKEVTWIKSRMSSVLGRRIVAGEG